MAKDLPYFKFFCSEWNDGDITLENFNIQGLFINVCSYYWSNECNVSFTKLKKKFSGFIDELEYLTKEKLIKVNNKDFVSISFLDEQRQERIKVSKSRSKGGKASAESRKKKKQEVNITSTQVEHVLKSSSTESQLLRREEKREEEILNIINNKAFLNTCLKDAQFMEVQSMQTKTNLDTIKKYLDIFEGKLIQTGEQKESLKQFKEHFTNWINKQEIVKVIPKKKQIRYF